ncbi:hypothetical protein IW147_004509 [Coemansia sp. RSA 720]|nr:hypothetical protein IW147_004509 [Coemansia sp. RSA 720]
MLSGFDKDAVQACVAREWLDANDKLGDAAVSTKDKPQLYKSKAGTTAEDSANKWSIGKGSTMANQKDFLSELRRQLAEQQ